MNQSHKGVSPWRRVSLTASQSTRDTPPQSRNQAIVDVLWNSLRKGQIFHLDILTHSTSGADQKALDMHTVNRMKQIPGSRMPNLEDYITRFYDSAAKSCKLAEEAHAKMLKTNDICEKEPYLSALDPDVSKEMDPTFVQEVKSRIRPRIYEGYYEVKELLALNKNDIRRSAKFIERHPRAGRFERMVAAMQMLETAKSDLVSSDGIYTPLFELVETKKLADLASRAPIQP